MGLRSAMRFTSTVGPIVSVACIASSPTAVASAAEPLRVYWTDGGWFFDSRIERSAVDGANHEVVLSLYKQINKYKGIDIDFVNGWIYWTFDRESIWRSRLDGSEQEMLLCFPDSGYSIESIALDVAGGKMYWPDEVLDMILSANLDGTDVQELVEIDVVGGSASRIQDVDLDLANGKMYWTDNGTHKIQRSNLDGTNVEDVRGNLGDVPDIAIDSLHGQLFFADYNNGIGRINVDGSGALALVQDVGAYGVDVDVQGGKVYWTRHQLFQIAGSGKIRRANLDGSQVEDLVSSGPNYPWRIAVIPDLVDICDFAALADCLTGPGGNQSLAGDCSNSDLDHDGDVDLVDFSILQTLFGLVPD